MPQVFISYRRADSGTIANRIYDRLVSEFGQRNVFKDVDDIPPGRDFREVLRESASTCDEMLVIIGHDWITTSDDSGTRRLYNPHDFVRFEVELGLQNENVRVIPVLVYDATPPKPDELPASIQQLAYLNAVRVRDDPDFHRDMDRLIKQLHPTDNLTLFQSGWIVGGAATLIVIALLIGGVFSSILGNSGEPTVPAVVDLPTMTSTLTPTQTPSLASTFTESPTITPLSNLPSATQYVSDTPAPTLNVTPTFIQSTTVFPTATVENAVAIVNVDNANLRSGPSTNYSRVGSATIGTTFPVIARTDASDWYLVERDSEGRAWIWAEIVDLDQESSQIEIVATVPSPPPLAQSSSNGGSTTSISIPTTFNGTLQGNPRDSHVQTFSTGTTNVTLTIWAERTDPHYMTLPCFVSVSIKEKDVDTDLGFSLGAIQFSSQSPPINNVASTNITLPATGEYNLIIRDGGDDFTTCNYNYSVTIQ
jgi:hypothetical protein